MWAPEHLFVAAFNRCYLLTLLAIAEFSKIAIVSCSSSAKGKLERVEGGASRIPPIIVRPRVVIASANDLARMARMKKPKKTASSQTRSRA